MKEEFEIVSAIDATGKDGRRWTSLDTLDREQGHWLDTGILSIG